jgi:hypothetical protein
VNWPMGSGCPRSRQDGPDKWGFRKEDGEKKQLAFYFTCVHLPQGEVSSRLLQACEWAPSHRAGAMHVETETERIDNMGDA